MSNAKPIEAIVQINHCVAVSGEEERFWSALDMMIRWWVKLQEGRRYGRVNLAEGVMQCQRWLPVENVANAARVRLLPVVSHASRVRHILKWLVNPCEFLRSVT